MALLSPRSLRQMSKKSLPVIPYVFTFANAFFGFLAVLEAINGHMLLAAYCIGLAACMDAIDGRIARKLGCASSFGAELDALCDAVSFCFAPAVLLFIFYDFHMNGATIIMLALYLCAGLFRLAKFNTTSTSSVTHFSGLPTTAAAFFLASLLVYREWIELSYIKFLLYPRGILFLVALLSLLMISAIPFPSFKSYKIRFPHTYIALIFFIGMIVICVMRGYPIFFLTLLGYIVLSCMYWVFMWAKHLLS